MGSIFELKDLNLLTYFLGLQIESSPLGIFVHQEKYDSNPLNRHNMFDILQDSCWYSTFWSFSLSEHGGNIVVSKVYTFWSLLCCESIFPIYASTNRSSSYHCYENPWVSQGYSLSWYSLQTWLSPSFHLCLCQLGWWSIQSALHQGWIPFPC